MVCNLFHIGWYCCKSLHYVTRFAITDTKLYLLVVPFSYQDNTKLLKLLKFGFKGTNNWNKYQWKITIQIQNQYLDCLIHPKLQRINKLFVLQFEDKYSPNKSQAILSLNCRNKRLQCYNQWTKIFWSATKVDLRTFSNIWKLQIVKDLITKLVVYEITPISKNSIRW